MPGSYTHLTIVRLLNDEKVLKDLQISQKVIDALFSYSEFCQMGAISPDYPYLNIINGRAEAEHWANSMHHKYPIHTEANILHLGIDYLKGLFDDQQRKCLSWFLGYTSHVVADVTCHPVTNLLVGDYEADNQTAHRISEMHQDAYIYKTRLGEEIGKSEIVQNMIGLCTDQNDNEKIDSDIEIMWKYILKTTFPKLEKRFRIDIHGWHNAIQFFLDDIAEEIAVIPSRHIRNIFTSRGVAYPRFENVNKNKFIDSLKTPTGNKTYDEIFDIAKTNVGKVWKLLSDGIFSDDQTYKDKLKVWNLDTGQEVYTPKVMWEGLA